MPYCFYFFLHFEIEISCLTFKLQIHELRLSLQGWYAGCLISSLIWAIDVNLKSIYKIISTHDSTGAQKSIQSKVLIASKTYLVYFQFNYPVKVMQIFHSSIYHILYTYIIMYTITYIDILKRISNLSIQKSYLCSDVLKDFVFLVWEERCTVCFFNDHKFGMFIKFVSWVLEILFTWKNIRPPHFISIDIDS